MTEKSKAESKSLVGLDQEKSTAIAGASASDPPYDDMLFIEDEDDPPIEAEGCVE